MKTVLITGGAGFIGSNFARFLYEKYPDYRLVVLDALTYAGNIRNLPEEGLNNGRLEFQYGNVRNAPFVEALVAQADYVVHFAAESHVTRSIYDNYCFFETDVLGTQVVANAVLQCRDRVKLFIHISTSEVYGSAATPKMDENHPLNPMSPYAAAKAGADRLVYSYVQTYRIPAVIVRPFNNYGAYQHLEKLIPRYITSVLLGAPLRIHGDGSAARDFVHVQDTCAALDRILHAPQGKVVGEVFNVGTGISLSIQEICDKVRHFMDSPQVETIPIGDRPGQVTRHTCDYSKINRVLDWAPKISFDDGLKQAIKWYTANTEWWKPQCWLREIPIVLSNGRRIMH